VPILFALDAVVPTVRALPMDYYNKLNIFRPWA
jgi:hypothetical protein